MSRGDLKEGGANRLSPEARQEVSFGTSQAIPFAATSAAHRVPRARPIRLSEPASVEPSQELATLAFLLRAPFSVLQAQPVQSHSDWSLELSLRAVT